MILNLLSTAAMVRMGRVYGNWMIHVSMTNQKLRKRGARILEEVAQVTAPDAERALRQAGYNLPRALVMLETAANPREAACLLAKANGNVRLAIESGHGRTPKRKHT
jgi:N-acetylmuramic acid 6-phosphate etherase